MPEGLANAAAPVAPGDEHDRIAAQVDAVEVHHVVDLSVHRARRPQAPTQPVPAPQRPFGDLRIPLRPCGQQPIEEALYILSAAIVGVGGAGAAAAFAAPPPGSSRAGRSVLLHSAAAARAIWCSHGTMEPALSNPCQTTWQ